MLERLLGESKIAQDRHKVVTKNGGKRGISLVELLVVMSITGVLMGILLPAVGAVRRRARKLLGVRNQGEIAKAVNFFAFDNDDLYPESVATVGILDVYWNWAEPTTITAYRRLSSWHQRSMGAYLREYVKDAEMMFCPNAPRKYKYLEQMWRAGDAWDNPETPRIKDPVVGTYCFYWNYIGYLEESRELFYGPSGPEGGPGESTVLVSDYFGYGHWRSCEHFGTCKVFSSCERFKGPAIIPETWVSSAYWARREGHKIPDVQLNAGYADGHVGSFQSSQAVEMKVSTTPDGSQPYPEGVGPGVFFLPREGVR